MLILKCNINNNISGFIFHSESNPVILIGIYHMYQRDYILRMIEMMGDFIAAILKMMKKEQFPEAFRMIENAYFEFLKEDAAFFLFSG
jgi:hypothetical protein